MAQKMSLLFGVVSFVLLTSVSLAVAKTQGDGVNRDLPTPPNYEVLKRALPTPPNYDVVKRCLPTPPNYEVLKRCLPTPPNY